MSPGPTAPRRSLAITVALLAMLVLFVVPTAISMAAERGVAPRPGDVRSFWTMQADGTSYRKVRAVLVFDGRLARVWVDVRDTGMIPEPVMLELQRALDTATGPESRNPALGIIENEWEVFGRSPGKYRVAGKDDFLMTDLPNTVPGMTLLGYFHTKDQFPSNVVRSSNEMNLLYIDSREGVRDLQRLLGTIAHEYQHLIGYGRNPDGERFFSEGLSELASLLIGYRHGNGSFLANPNTPMFRFSDADASAAEVDYERGMSLMSYLHEQYGDRFIRELVGAPGTGPDRIETALERAGVGLATNNWGSIAARFAVASYLQGDGEGEYGIRRTLAPERARRPASIRSEALARWDVPVANLEANGVAYVEYRHPQVELEVPAGAQKILAIVYRGNVATVRELSPGRQELRTDGGADDRVVLVLVNTAGQRNAVRWTADRADHASMQ